MSPEGAIGEGENREGSSRRSRPEIPFVKLQYRLWQKEHSNYFIEFQLICLEGPVSVGIKK